jgi:hypothetical protein
MTKLIENEWQATKEALCEGKDLQYNMDGTVSNSKRQIMNVLLENARNEFVRINRLNETATAGGTASGNIATLNKVILPVLRRVMPTVIANEIIGVQPMTSPVHQVHTLRVRYADTAAGETAGNEALSPFDIAKGYSGNGQANSGTPGAATTAGLEGLAGNRMNIQILKMTVEAQTRRLSARWTFEAQQDAMAQQGIDIEAEITAALAQEITTEIDQEILQTLRALPGTPVVTYDQSQTSGTATFVGDEHAALATLINYQANLIGARTRRGAANWLVVSPTALTILQSGGTSAFARTTEGVFEAPTNNKFVGVLNNSMRVYVDQYASSDTPVLMGYKGAGELDAAAYYCPYVPLTSTGTVMDPATFEPVMSFYTRYGFLKMTDSTQSFGNSADYLSTIAINTANLRFF